MLTPAFLASSLRCFAFIPPSQPHCFWLGHLFTKLGGVLWNFHSRNADSPLSLPRGEARQDPRGSRAVLWNLRESDSLFNLLRLGVESLSGLRRCRNHYAAEWPRSRNRRDNRRFQERRDVFDWKSTTVRSVFSIALNSQSESRRTVSETNPRLRVASIALASIAICRAAARRHGVLPRE